MQYCSMQAGAQVPSGVALQSVGGRLRDARAAQKRVSGDVRCLRRHTSKRGRTREGKVHAPSSASKIAQRKASGDTTGNASAVRSRTDIEGFNKCHSHANLR